MKWCLNHPFLAQVVADLNEFSGTKTTTKCYKPLRKSEIKKEEKKIKDVIDILQNEYLNPFVIPDLDPNELFNLSSGVPLQSGAEELLNIWNQGKELAEEFWSDRLLSTKIPFQDPVNK